jgi:hypothetical protein
VRVANPQTYTFYCSYIPEAVNSLNECDDLSCKYHQRIVAAKASGIGGFLTGVKVSEVLIGAIGSAPAIGGTSVAIAAGGAVVCGAYYVGIGLIARLTIKQTIKSVEKELKLK